MAECLGRHYIIEFESCNTDTIESTEMVEKALLKAVGKAGATYVSHDFHQFNPYGVSGVVVIAESHFTIHTWPEKDYAAVDIFTCGEMDADAAIEYLRSFFDAGQMTVKVLQRGTSLPEE